jgi:hypothetical protein
LLTYNLSQAHEGWKDGLSVEERRAFLQQFNFIDTEQVLDLKHIPNLSQQPVVARVDTHGNLKLSIAVSDAKPEWFGKRLNVVINGHSCEAEIREHMFDAKSGHYGIAPGSSGAFADSAKDDPRFLELAMIGKSLREEPGHHGAGSQGRGLYRDRVD